MNLTNLNHLKMKPYLISPHYFIILHGCLQYNISAEEINIIFME